MQRLQDCQSTDRKKLSISLSLSHSLSFFLTLSLSLFHSDKKDSTRAKKKLRETLIEIESSDFCSLKED
jgi:hypothetical protein